MCIARAKTYVELTWRGVYELAAYASLSLSPSPSPCVCAYNYTTGLFSVRLLSPFFLCKKIFFFSIYLNKKPYIIFDLIINQIHHHKMSMFLKSASSLRGLHSRVSSKNPSSIIAQ